MIINLVFFLVLCITFGSEGTGGGGGNGGGDEIDYQHHDEFVSRDSRLSFD